MDFLFPGSEEDELLTLKEKAKQGADQREANSTRGLEAVLTFQ